ncbi:MAG: SDR family oxidoreductase [Parachlamydiaceae bacterium]|nr:SDR family oxidoreductase [Parachlamydiaceae bacterium]
MTNNKYALITGASGGIGKEMAIILFDHGYNLVLVSRRISALQKVKNELLEINKDQTIEIFEADLSKKEAAQSLYQYTKILDISIDVLINNAGSGMYGEIEGIDTEELYDMLMLNNYSLTCLCKLYSQDMIDKKSGYILNVASLGAYQPVPYISAYAASKTYVLNFSEAIAMELKDYNVSVTCFSPGHTDTNFFKQASIPDSHQFYEKSTREDPKNVAEDAIKSMFSKKLSVIHGFKNKFLGTLNKFCPRYITAMISKSLVTRNN